MNKKLLLGLGLLLLLGGGYFLMNKSKAPATTETSTGTETQTESSAPNSLKNLLTSSAAQKCTFSLIEGDSTNEGTVYVSAGKVRGDFMMTASGKTSNSYMITDGKTIYIWGSEMGSQGLKMMIPEGESDASTSTTTGAGSLANLDQTVDYSCTPWVVNASLFTPPSDVTFSDLPSFGQ